MEPRVRIGYKYIKNLKLNKDLPTIRYALFFIPKNHDTKRLILLDLRLDEHGKISYCKINFTYWAIGEKYLEGYKILSQRNSVSKAILSLYKDHIYPTLKGIIDTFGIDSIDRFDYNQFAKSFFFRFLTSKKDIFKDLGENLPKINRTINSCIRHSVVCGHTHGACDIVELHISVYNDYSSQNVYAFTLGQQLVEP